MSNSTITFEGRTEDVRFCPACGSQIFKMAQFCPMCGQKLGLIGTTIEQEKTEPTVIIEKADEKPAVKYADPGERLLAFIIDSIIINAVVSLVIFMIRAAAGLPVNDLSTSPFNLIAMFIYFFVNEKNTGQTIGKRIMNIKTVDETTHGPINSEQALIHILGKVFFLPIDVFIGLIVGDREKKDGKPNLVQVRATQRVAKTVVIKV